MSTKTLNKNSQLLNLYKTTTQLQEADDVNEIYDIALNAFISLNFDRVRIYSYENNIITGKRCNYLSNFNSITIDALNDKTKAYKCIQIKQPVIDKTKKNNPYRELLEKPVGLISASLPLISKNDVIGVISVDNIGSNLPILEEDLNLLMTFSNQIANAIHNAQLSKENKKKIQSLSALFDITSTINQTLDLDKVINLIVVKIIKISKADVCELLLLDDKKEKLLYSTSYGLSEDLLEKIIPIESTAFQDPLKYQQPIFHSELPDDLPKVERYKSLSFSNLLIIPLIIEDNPIGIINIYRKQNVPYTDDEKKLFNTLANQAAIAIENSRLYIKIRNDKEILSRILEISKEIISTLDLNLMCKIIIEKTLNLTAADGAEITLHNQKIASINNEIQFPTQNQSITAVQIDDIQENNLCSIAILPIKMHEQPIGYLRLASKRAGSFKRFKKALEVLTNHIAIAIENVNLYNEVRSFNDILKEEIDKATKDLREKNLELRKLDQTKSDFVSNVSHELRTPLTSIAGYSKLMLAQKLGTITPQQKQGLGIIVEESDRLTRLIDDILNLSKLESGTFELTKESINILQLIDHCTSALKTISEEKEIEITIKTTTEVPYLEVSKDHIKQVIYNLLSNALKFTGAKGKISITVWKTDHWLKISVQDTGRGIPKEKLPKLFDKFYQVDSSMTKEAAGTGLGLVIVKRILELHNGRIKAESELGKGSTFTVYLPLKENEPTAQ